MKSASSNNSISILNKCVYLYKLLCIKIRTKEKNVAPIDDINLYDSLLRKWKNKSIKDSKVLEVGYGARPWRLLSLIARNVDAIGIDLDMPAIGADFRGLIKAWKRNGLERAIKSFIRGYFFDKNELERLQEELGKIKIKWEDHKDRFLVGNAVDHKSFEESSFDFCYSEDVFEHMPEEILKSVLRNIFYWLKPGALAFIRPHVFTGIAGGHAPNFYPHLILAGKVDQSRAWEHLWDNNFSVNTYLNKLRIYQYRDYISEHFEILEVTKRNVDLDLGKELLTDSLKKQLSDYTEEELLTNQIGFVLRSKK